MSLFLGHFYMARLSCWGLVPRRGRRSLSLLRRDQTRDLPVWAWYATPDAIKHSSAHLGPQALRTFTWGVARVQLAFLLTVV